MSKFVIKEKICPFCGAMETRSIAQSLSVARSPHLKKAILDEEFQLFSCSMCKEKYYVEDPFFYMDFNDKHWIAVYPLCWEPEWRENEHESTRLFDMYLKGEYAPPIAHEMATGFSVRTVFGLLNLADKLRCFDAELNDISIELLKLHLMKCTPELDFDIHHRPLLDKVQEGMLTFKVMDEMKNIEKVTFYDMPVSDYHAILLNHSYEHAAAFIGNSAYISIGKLFFDSRK